MAKLLRRWRELGSLLPISLLLSATASAQSWQSARALPTGTGEASTISSVIADGTGGYFIAGQFTGTLTLGSYSLTSVGNSDAFVARLNAAGTYVQAVRAGGSGNDVATKLAVDAAGLLTVGGEFASPTITFGTTTLANRGSDNDIFVARLTDAGTWTQAAQCGSAADDDLVSLALDPNGSAVVAGSFEGVSANFGSYTLAKVGSYGTNFVARLGRTGSWIQAVRLESGGTPILLSDMGVAADGTAVIAGYCASGGGITFGNYDVDTGRYGGSLYVARLARNGTWVQVAQSTGTGSKTIARRMVVDAAGNVVVAGEYDGPTRFGSLRINLASRGNFVPFVARLSANGTWTQVTQAENTSDSCAADALVLDGNDNVWLAGRFKSPVISFGSTTFTNSDPNAYTTNHFDLFIAQLSSAGNWTFATAVASALPQALALNRGQATLVGNFNSSVAFGTTTLTSSAQVTGFLATLNGGVLPTLTPAPADPAGLAWPNPAGSYTTVSLPATAAPRPVQLFDALGREVRRLELPARATSLKMNLVGLPSGCYLLRCGTSSGRLLVD